MKRYTKPKPVETEYDIFYKLFPKDSNDKQQRWISSKFVNGKLDSINTDDPDIISYVKNKGLKLKN